MARVLSDLLREIDELSSGERAQLLAYLIERLEAPADVDVRAAWQAESERRLDEIESGKVRTISGAEFIAEMRARFK